MELCWKDYKNHETPRRKAEFKHRDNLGLSIPCQWRRQSRDGDVHAIAHEHIKSCAKRKKRIVYSCTEPPPPPPSTIDRPVGADCTRLGYYNKQTQYRRDVLLAGNFFRPHAPNRTDLHHVVSQPSTRHFPFTFSSYILTDIRTVGRFVT